MPIARPAKRKITIKAYKQPPKLPPNYYDATSGKLLEATRAILDKKSSLALQDSYNSVVHLCSHQFGPTLYSDLVQEMKRATAQILATPPSKDAVLEYVTTQYPLFVEYLLLVKDIYLVLDRQYVWDADRAVKRTSSQPHGLVEVGLAEFATRLQVLELDAAVYQEWWNQLWDDWKHVSCTMPLLGSTMVMWQDLQCKLPVVRKLQVDLQASLTQVSREWQDNGTTKYVPEKCLTFIHAQWMHVSQHWGVFLPKTWLRTMLEVHLLEPHLNTQFLLKDLDFTNLDFFTKLWFLAARLEGGLERVVAAVVAHGKALGLACVKEVNGTPKTVIGGLLKLQDHLSKLQKSVGDIPMKQIWSDVLNVDPNVAEFLAKYIDGSLRNHKATPPLAAILQLFSNLQAKDIFEAFYKKDLAKRLLNQRVQSMDVERQLVSLLKVECGAGYTSKMEGMFQDVEWSRETMQRWKDSTDYVPNDKCEMEVQILTTGYWPVYPQYEGLVLPDAILKPQSEFANHYRTKYQGRKIVWQYALGGCQVRFRVGENKVYDLLVSLGQTLVLLCFNHPDRPRWKLSEICAAIGMPDRDEGERMLQSLSLGKEGTRILRRIAPSGSTKPGPLISDDDVFVVNEKFTSQHRRIKINNILWKETKDDREKVVEGVSRDRLYLIDAVLVRIMKARKTILHQQLILQVLEQVKVPAQPGDIKKRIESLIEREYMERDEKDRNRYNYLA
jgi:cullin 4